MATTINSTDLDFTNIKSSLKTFLQQQAEFADYDFEGSGLSNILDVLAYNTHYNGLIANFALNESFLSSSQLRSSVLSHAEALGYRARSITSAEAIVNLTITVASGDPAPSSITLPIGTKFTSTVAGLTYTFQTRAVYTADAESSGTSTVYKFKTTTGYSSATDTSQNTIYNIPILEGTSTDKTFLVGETSENQVYVIPDTSANINTLIVSLYETTSATTYTSYNDIQNIIRITPTSRVFNVQETPNGFYELVFGIDTGIIPNSGNKLTVNYLKSIGADANGGITFTPTAQLAVSGTNQTIVASTVSASAGGASKETISSIKTQAPLLFASQQRLVTAEDYRSQILNKYSSTVRDVNAYGGEQATPAKYGVVYASLKFFDDVSTDTQATIKTDILQNLTNNLSILSVSTEFVDPVTTFLELTTTYNLNPTETNLTSSSVASLITNEINTFFTTNLQTFNKVFRRSNLLTSIDSIDQAILNSKIDIKLQQRITPVIGIATNYTLTYPVALATPDDVNYIINSTNFTYSGNTASIRNKLNSNILQIVTSGGVVALDDVGSYNATSGVVTITGLNISAFTGDVIKVFVTPANQSTIKPLLNYILDIDATRSTVTTIIDKQDINAIL